uniref:Uncharacterized protein n=1 Tax=Anguilla anguilla TaxID=7936 RepID=A0A0E9VRH3_ANGAN
MKCRMFNGTVRVENTTASTCSSTINS